MIEAVYLNDGVRGEVIDKPFLLCIRFTLLDGSQWEISRNGDRLEVVVNGRDRISVEPVAANSIYLSRA